MLWGAAILWQKAWGKKGEEGEVRLKGGFYAHCCLDTDIPCAWP